MDPVEKLRIKSWRLRFTMREFQFLDWKEVERKFGANKALRLDATTLLEKGDGELFIRDITTRLRYSTCYTSICRGSLTNGECSNCSIEDRRWFLQSSFSSDETLATSDIEMISQSSLLEDIDMVSQLNDEMKMEDDVFGSDSIFEAMINDPNFQREERAALQCEEASKESTRKRVLDELSRIRTPSKYQRIDVAPPIPSSSSKSNALSGSLSSNWPTLASGSGIINQRISSTLDRDSKIGVLRRFTNIVNISHSDDSLLGENSFQDQRYGKLGSRARGYIKPASVSIPKGYRYDNRGFFERLTLFTYDKREKDPAYSPPCAKMLNQLLRELNPITEKQYILPHHRFPRALWSKLLINILSNVNEKFLRFGNLSPDCKEVHCIGVSHYDRIAIGKIEDPDIPGKSELNPHSISTYCIAPGCCLRATDARTRTDPLFVYCPRCKKDIYADPNFNAIIKPRKV